MGVGLGKIVQILRENLVFAAGAQHVWHRGDTSALGDSTGHQSPELPALMELDTPTFPLSLAQLGASASVLPLETWNKFVAHCTGRQINKIYWERFVL